jgi:hypothetical protein
MSPLAKRWQVSSKSDQPPRVPSCMTNSKSSSQVRAKRIAGQFILIYYLQLQEDVSHARGFVLRLVTSI